MIFTFDDINITAYTEDMILVEEWTMGPDWNLHPNPSAQNSNLSCTLVSDHEARITLVDASGRIVDTIYEGKLTSRTSQLPAFSC